MLSRRKYFGGFFYLPIELSEIIYYNANISR